MSTFKLAAGNPGIKYTDTTTLTFNYTGGHWIFSLTNISPEVQRLINEGYIVRLQTIRYIGGKTKSTYKSSGTSNGNTGPKKPPSMSLDVTSAVSSSPTSIDATSLITEIIYNDQQKVFGRQPLIIESYYASNGEWYRNYKFCIIINNVAYATSSIFQIMTQYPSPIPPEHINPNYYLAGGYQLNLTYL